MWGGETNAQELRRIADVVDKYGIRTVKVTGGQRIDLLGVKKADLPAVWADLGMPSGHAYAKALRTVKTCVGSEWCRFGTQDSTDMGQRLERALWRMYAPHKVKLAVSGCPRNCAESGIKDVGVIGVESGWEIYVAGNGGIKTEVAQFLVKVKTAEEVLEHCGRVPAALSRGRLVSRAHRALRGPRRARTRQESAARGCRQPSRALGAAAIQRSTASRIRGTTCKRPASTRGSSSRSRGDRVMALDVPVGATYARTSQRASVCALAEIPILGARVIERRGNADGDVAVFRTDDDRVFAVLDRCPHKGGPLSQGIVYRGARRMPAAQLVDRARQRPGGRAR